MFQHSICGSKGVALKVSSILVAILVVFAPGCLAQSNGSDYKKTCKSKKSDFALAYCDILWNEYNTGKLFKNNSYPESGALLSPLANQEKFLGSVENEAFRDVVVESGKSALQGDANDIAQMVSTKAAVAQTGAGTNTTGSTSLVSKPTTTDLISLAAESGAFTDTQNGSTLTAQANLNGLRRYLSNENFASIEKSSWEQDALQHLTVAATFNVAQSGSTNASTTGTATSSTPANLLSVLIPSNNLTFNSIGATFQIYRSYTPTSKAFRTAWSKAISDYDSKSGSGVFSSYTSDADKFNSFLGASTPGSPVSLAQLAWKSTANKAEVSGDFGDFVDGFVAYMNVWVAQLKIYDTTYDQDIVNAVQASDKIEDARNSILDNARGLLATITYTYTTPPGKPATHDATGVLSYVPKTVDPGAQLTINFGASWFVSVPTGAKYGSLKEYQFSGEFDQPLPRRASSPKATVSLAGYGQYQYAANVLNVTISSFAPNPDISVPANSQVFTSTPGWLGIAQAKLTFNIGKGASIPVAAKWSNKTDLLQGSDWKGQFGFSYDLSALQSMLLPKK
jgi:hypothetical protein